MKDELLSQIEALIDDPAPLLNLPTADLLHWLAALDALGDLVGRRVYGGPTYPVVTVDILESGKSDAPY